ncbi:MAG: transposase [Methanosarcinaceae archaeon]|nr:transposase [Methanosarcinaceae archaeon]
MIKTYKFRIYPSKQQEVKLISTLNTCRWLYNSSLSERKHQAEMNRLYSYLQLFSFGKPEWINYYDQSRNLTLYKTDEQKQIYSQVIRDVLKRLDRSFKNFFNGYGYPRFQGRNRYDSFTYPQSGFSITDEGKLKLSKIGEIKLIQHREIEGKIKTCTIKRDVDQWYVSFAVEMDTISCIEMTGKSIGVDVGLKSLITLSNGQQIEPPQFLRQSGNKLAKQQRSLSRKKKGSNNRDKQRIKVGKLHRTIRNQRLDFAHKVSRELVNVYDLIVFEKLQIQNMVKNHHLAKSISDAGWDQLIQLTKHKAEYACKVVKLVDPKNTTQNCSSCGIKVPKSLSVRTHKCPYCGLELDRDVNAAINILNLSTVGTTGRACGLTNVGWENEAGSHFLTT